MAPETPAGFFLLAPKVPNDIKHVGTLEVGEIAMFDSGKKFEVIQQGSMGTTIQYLARVAKHVRVTDDEGKEKTVKFSSAGRRETISSATIVRRAAN